MANNFCCSIETEPKTLKEGQLNQAREVAVDIILNKEPDEATSLFIDAHFPVSVAIDKEMAAAAAATLMMGNKEEEEEAARVVVKKEIIDHHHHHELYSVVQTTSIVGNSSSCQCSRPSAVIDSPADDQFNLREPLTAPF